MKRVSVLLAALLLLSALLSGCSRVEENAWECPVEGLSWGMSASQAQEIYPLTETTGSTNYSSYTMDTVTELFGVEGEVTLYFSVESGLDSVGLDYKEEKAGTLAKNLQKRYGKPMKSDSDTVSYGGYWSGDKAGTLYTEDELIYAYRNYYKIDVTSSSYQELKAQNISEQSLYYVRVIENEDGEGNAMFAATLAEFLKVIME